MILSYIVKMFKGEGRVGTESLASSIRNGVRPHAAISRVQCAGDAFIHDFMEGEALNNPEWQDRLWTFKII